MIHRIDSTSAAGRLLLLILVLATTMGAGLLATGSSEAQNHAPNPYTTVEGGWGKLPAGRAWGATSAIYPARDGSGNIWVAERCGENTCDGKDDVDPILLFDPEGNLVRSFGAGLILWPHGMYVDADNNVWVADALGFGEQPAGRGHEVLKFSPDGELLMSLGTKGVSGNGHDAFAKPCDVLVAPDGSIFVADGHYPDGNDRIVKFAADGSYLMEWGETGSENGQFREPHGLAMDAQGRLFVADRYNNRVQIFDQQGEHLASWSQFGRPSGLYIDEHDVLYSADSESRASRNPGWKRGIRIGRVGDGFVTAFIPDTEPDQDDSGTSAAEGVAADAMGNVYGAEVGPRMLRKYVRQAEEMTFFMTSNGPGDGANLGGLAGADAHCQALATAVGAGHHTWRAYLSTTASAGQPAVNARDRIGSGPWRNANGVTIASDVTELHGENNLTKATQVSERGDVINGRGDSPNRHDILTGSQLDGAAFADGEDHTCSNWTSNGAGSAQVGHHDRNGGGDNPTSWNAAHASRGCGQADLRGTGGDGLFYCFALSSGSDD